MHYTNTIFNQLLQFLPKHKFKQFVGQHDADKDTKRLSTWSQLIAMLYAQATGKDSLREVETGLSVHPGQWYHLDIGSVARSTLSDANNRRDAAVFEKLFYALLERCREVTPQRSFSFKNPLYSLDASTITLCLSVFDWSKATKTKGALKLHTLLDQRTSIPEVVTMSAGRKHEIKQARETIDLEQFEQRSILVFDRGFVDWSWWYAIDQAQLFFVSRAKDNHSLTVLGQHAIPDGDVLADEYIFPGGYEGSEQYPARLRRVRFYDRENDRVFEYLTNNMELTGYQVAEIYRSRWQIELFYKWVKQNLKIKTFLGTSQNAVMTQIWIAMIYYLLLVYIKFQTKFSQSLLALTRMISEALMVRRSLIDLLSLNTKTVRKLTNTYSPQRAFW